MKFKIPLVIAFTATSLSIPTVSANVSNQQQIDQQTQLTQTNNQPNPNQTTNTYTPTKTQQSDTSAFLQSQTSSNPFYYDDYGFSHFTRYNLAHFQDDAPANNRGLIANFNGQRIQNMTMLKDTRPKYKGQQLNVWDSWPLQDTHGNVINYHGFHIVFALAGNPKANTQLLSGQKIQDSHIYVLYQKINQQNQGIKSWHSAGKLFNSNEEGTNGFDETLNEQLAEWSGDTIMNSNGQIQIFYTSFNGSAHNNWQTLATANIQMSVKKHKIVVDHWACNNHKTILKADGQTYEQLSQTNPDGLDENVFRDPHYFEYQNHRYLMFAANSSLTTGPANASALNNTAYLGGDNDFQNQESALFIDNNQAPIRQATIDDNAVIGVVELGSTNQVITTLKPMLGMNTVTDEFERPNLIEHQGKWYLFGITRGYKLATQDVKRTDSYLFGFVADSPFGPFKPLNGNGLVIRNTRAWKSRLYTYSFYILNNHDQSNRFVVTSYMGNSNQKGFHQTFAPSMTININQNRTYVNAKALSQGQLVP